MFISFIFHLVVAVLFIIITLELNYINYIFQSYNFGPYTRYISYRYSSVTRNMSLVSLVSFKR